MQYQFQAVPGSHLSDEQAQVYGDRLTALEEKGNGSLTPEAVLEDARDPKSPLHEYFQWNNKTAAEQFRLRQARYLLRSIQVVISTEDAEHTVRAFHNVIVKQGESSEQVYAGVVRVLSESELRAQMLSRALQEIERWRKRYATYQELLPIFHVIDTIQI